MLTIGQKLILCRCLAIATPVLALGLCIEPMDGTYPDEDIRIALLGLPAWGLLSIPCLLSSTAWQSIIRKRWLRIGLTTVILLIMMMHFIYTLGWIPCSTHDDTWGWAPSYAATLLQALMLLRLTRHSGASPLPPAARADIPA